MRLEFHPLFASDLEEAALYYDEHEPGSGLGARFVREADDAVSLIESNPQLGGFIHRPKGIHHILLRRFPYAIHYRVVSADVLLIVGIYHGARDPIVWQERF